MSGKTVGSTVPSAADTGFMSLALAEARTAAELGEVPVGAVIVKDGAVIASAHNQREVLNDATAHAEILAVREACRVLGGWRLSGCTLYVTLEPCAMCAGAAVNSRLSRIVFGAYDFRFGSAGSIADIPSLPLNHRPSVLGGVMRDECEDLLRGFFEEKR